MFQQMRSLRIRIHQIGTAVAGVAVACSVALWAGDSTAYQFYSDGVSDTGRCAQCHTAFKKPDHDYVSAAEDFAWGDTLHDAHTRNTDIASPCGNCHDGAETWGTKLVNLSNSDAAQDGVNFVSCMGWLARVGEPVCASITTKQMCQPTAAVSFVFPAILTPARRISWSQAKTSCRLGMRRLRTTSSE